jgi:hypothetical protein
MQRAAMAIGLVLAGWSSVLYAQANPSASPENDLPHGGGIIRGRITAAATGAPIHSATVQATISSFSAAPITTVTDSDGAFELRGLSPGRWRVDAAKSGFLTRSFGQRGTPPRVETLTLKDRAIVTADIALERAGVLTGRVLDEFGEPAVDLRVQVMRSQRTVAGRQLTPVGPPDVTDDTGAFRIYGLAPGDYYVSARGQTTLDRVRRAAGNERQATVTLSGADAVGGLILNALPTYFPGTPDIDAAERITIEAGEERAGLDFALGRIVTVRVTGRILESSGDPPIRPVSIALFSTSSNANAMFMRSSRIAANGRFEFHGIPSGTYIIAVATTAPSDRPEFAEMTLDVGAEDVADLTIVTAPGVTLDGTFVSSSGTPLMLPEARVTPIPVGGRLPAMPGPPARAVVDNAFHLSNLWGTYLLSVQGLPESWTVKSIEVDGVDATGVPVTISSGRPQATIVLTDQLTSVSAAVTSEGRPVKAAIAIFPDDPAKWTTRRYFRSLRTDDQGTLSVRGLPSYDGYLAVATDYLEPADLLDPEFLERLRPHASAFALDDGEVRGLALKLVERSAIDGR